MNYEWTWHADDPALCWIKHSPKLDGWLVGFGDETLCRYSTEELAQHGRMNYFDVRLFPRDPDSDRKDQPFYVFARGRRIGAWYDYGQALKAMRAELDAWQRVLDDVAAKTVEMIESFEMWPCQVCAEQNPSDTLVWHDGLWRCLENCVGEPLGSAIYAEQADAIKLSDALGALGVFDKIL